MVHNDSQTLCPGEQKESVKNESHEEEVIIKKFKTVNGVHSEESNNIIIKIGASDVDDYFFSFIEDDDDKNEANGSPIVDTMNNFASENTQFPSWIRNMRKKEIDAVVPLATIRIRNTLQPSSAPNIMRNVSFNLSSLASIEAVYSSPSSLSKRSSLKRSFTSSALCIH